MFGEHLKANSQVSVAIERLGIVTTLCPISKSDIEECRAMKEDIGAKYGVYLACADLFKEGLELFEKGEIFSPFDITDALNISEAMELFEIIKEISGFGKSNIKILSRMGESKKEDLESDFSPLHFDMDYDLERQNNDLQLENPSQSLLFQEKLDKRIEIEKSESLAFNHSVLDFAKVFAENLAIASRNI